MTALYAAQGLKLPFRFDAVQLQRDLDLVAPGEWTDHYNERDFGGQWQGAALRSPRGAVDDLNAGPPGHADFTDTPLLARCGYIREALAEFRCPLKSVRFLSLAPKSFIKEHSDNALGYQDGEIRIHIPIRTNPGVEFYVCGDRLLLEEGDCYYINVNLPHRVNNRGGDARVHLVIDAGVNDWVRELFERCVGNADANIVRSAQPPGGFEEFADAIFSDEELRENLRAIPRRETLLRAAVGAAEARGFDLNEADLEAASRAASSTALHGSEGWLPIRMLFRDGKPRAKWIYAPEIRFTEGSFDESVGICIRQPFTALFQREMPLAEGRIRPDGFIFHMSRCGSTLISRSLAAAESTRVIAEAPPLDEVVQANSPDRAKWLEWVVSALAGQRREPTSSYLIKLDAWHIRSLPLFRAVFPDVPWIFVYRDPLEVLVSLVNKPGKQACPGLVDPAIFGLPDEYRTLTRQAWCVRVIESLMTAALPFREDPKGLFVNYNELPGAIWGRVALHFGLRLTADEEARVKEATLLDAKNTWRPFESDIEVKQKMIRSLEPDPAFTRLESLYRELASPIHV